MTKLVLTIATFLLLNFKAKTQNKKADNNNNNNNNNNNKVFNNTEEAQKASVIYDTLVFNEGMNGEILDEKFNSGKNELKFYKKFINSTDINKLIILNEGNTKTEIKYLGEIKDLNKKSSYHVVTNFKIIGIGEMPSPRGKVKLLLSMKVRTTQLFIICLCLKTYQNQSRETSFFSSLKKLKLEFRSLEDFLPSYVFRKLAVIRSQTMSLY